jgi:uncharacterized protein involved in exopolysaccharide biosynthesis
MHELSDLAGSIRRHYRLALALYVVLVAIGAGAIMFLPRTYATSSQVLVKRPDTTLQSTGYPQIDALLAWNRDTAIETYAALARQPAVAQRVIRQLGLKASVKDLLSRSVTVSPLTNSDIINIGVDWQSAPGSAAIANAFARAFIERQRVLAASQASEAGASLSVALNKAQADLSNADRALTLFESRHELADANTQTTSLLSAIGDVQSKERAVDDERVQAEGQLSSIVGQLSSLPQTVDASKTISSSPIADQIEQQLAQQRLQLSLLRRQFTEKYPDVIATQKQIASLQSELTQTPPTKVTSRNVELNPLNTALTSQAATLQSQIAGDFEQYKLLRSQESGLLGQLRRYPEDVSELSDLQRQAKAAESIYDALQNNYFNAVVAKSMAVSDVSLIQVADPSLATVRPPRLLALFTVIGIAFFATIGIIYLLDWYAVGSMSLIEAPGLYLPPQFEDPAARKRRSNGSSTTASTR